MMVLSLSFLFLALVPPHLRSASDLLNPKSISECSIYLKELKPGEAHVIAFGSGSKWEESSLSRDYKIERPDTIPIFGFEKHLITTQIAEMNQLAGTLAAPKFTLIWPNQSRVDQLVVALLLHIDFSDFAGRGKYQPRFNRATLAHEYFHWVFKLNALKRAAKLTGNQNLLEELLLEAILSAVNRNLYSHANEISPLLLGRSLKNVSQKLRAEIETWNEGFTYGNFSDSAKYKSLNLNPQEENLVSTVIAPFVFGGSLPYEELFADLGAVVYTGDPLAMTHYNPEGSVESLGRNFSAELDPRSWRETESHGLFGPARSFIGRNYILGERVIEPPKLLETVFDAIIDDYMEGTHYGKGYTEFGTPHIPTARKMNQRMIHRIQNRIGR